MANKKKTAADKATDMVVATGVSDSAPANAESITVSATAYTKDTPIETAEEYIPSTIWIAVEDSTDVGTYAMNLPSGCMVLVVVNGKPAMHYVAGIHYDGANKRFSV